MGKKNVLERVISVFAPMTDETEIREDSKLIEDLGINSMDILYLIVCLEEEFGIRIPEKVFSKIVTVGDVVNIVASLTEK